ncbi:hypothetical protein XFLAVUS301_20930 [Xanthobacter flavus]|uniref:Uncharacterized protein n=1 Tax=Xanthobacter flavus TaxID=281 RepID=A0A9W6CNC5_XANFL|nr:hypothetical protein XFLAVUS301_20930 [Xanthobacter flavus]
MRERGIEWASVASSPCRYLMEATDVSPMAMGQNRPAPSPLAGECWGEGCGAPRRREWRNQPPHPSPLSREGRGEE